MTKSTIFRKEPEIRCEWYLVLVTRLRIIRRQWNHTDMNNIE